MKKIYIHWNILSGGLFSIFLSIVCLLSISEDGINVWNIFCLFTFGLLSILCLFALWIHRHNEQPKPKTKRKLQVVFDNKHIEFPDGYFFKSSPINKSKRIELNEINEININTYPPSIVINNNEVIFLNYDDNEALKTFAKVNKLTISERFDIWEVINSPYLDNEIEESVKLEMKKNLEKNGISEAELKRIRSKIKWTMFGYTLAMEWMYLGQFDYLAATWLSEKKYWWTMDIALRNYKD